MREVMRTEKLCVRDILSLVKERQPFFKIWDAVVEKDCDGRSQRLIAYVTITPEECEGHFENDPRVPLIHIQKYNAQAGLVFFGKLTEHRKDATPIAFAHGAG